MIAKIWKNEMCLKQFKSVPQYVLFAETSISGHENDLYWLVFERVDHDVFFL